MPEAMKITDYFEDNPLLVSIEQGKPYTQTLKLIKQSLTKQWNDLLATTLIDDLYRDFPKLQASGKSHVVTKDLTVADLEIREYDRQRQELAPSTGDNTEEVIISAAVIAYLLSRISSGAKSINDYNDFNSKMFGYLKHVADKAGQNIIDQMMLPQNIEFRLSKEEYRKKIQERVNVLVTNIDQTTKERLANKIAKGVEEHKTKSAMIKELKEFGKTFSENRAKVIIHTETQAISEYIRHETARLNGIKTKTWKTVGDHKVTDICRSLDGQKVEITADFKGIKFEGPYPPAHVNCRSWIIYDINQGAWMEYQKSHDATSLALVKKGIDQFGYQTTNNEPLPIFNPNAIWAGGENLVGTDKLIGSFYQAIKTQYAWQQKVEDAIHVTDDKMWIEQTAYFARNEVERVVREARDTMTDAGFIQLMLALGIQRKFSSKVEAK